MRRTIAEWIRTTLDAAQSAEFTADEVRLWQGNGSFGADKEVLTSVRVHSGPRGGRGCCQLEAQL